MKKVPDLTISPSLLIILGIISLQLGAAIATYLFPIVGTEGTVAIRIVFSAFILGVTARRQIASFPNLFLKHWKLLVPFGLCITLMNFCFYKAIELIPLGTAVAIGFIGPLGVAAFTSRRFRHFVWIGLAAIGILLLTPLSGANLNPLGVAFELGAAVGWASFILLAGRVGKRISGNDGLAMAMIIAAFTMLPFFMPIVPQLLSSPLLLLIGIGVALLSTSLPFTLEFHALKQLPARTYGILISLEPAIATLIGVALLGDAIDGQGLVAIVCIVVAALGIALEKEEG